MADPLSVAASLAGLINLAQAIIQGGYRYCNTAKNCPKEIESLLNEVTSLSGVLSALKPVIHRLAPIGGANRNITQAQQIVSCTDTLEEIKKNLDTFTGGKKGKGPNLLERMQWPLKKDEVVSVMSRLDSYKRTFQLALSADTISSVMDLLDRLEICSQKFDEIQNEQKGIRNEQARVEETRKEEAANVKRDKVLQWLFSGDPHSKHQDIRKKRHKDTGSWFYETKEFRDWSKGKSPRLWCPGNPGAGKTFIMSNVVDHISEEFKGGEFGIAYIYCSFGDQSNQTPTRIFASILRQLGYRKSQLPPQIEALYDRLSPKSERPSVEDLLSVVTSVAQEFTKVWFFFDALDECQEHRAALLSGIKRLQGSNIQLFATSRPHMAGIRRTFEAAITLEISANREDIVTFARSELTSTRLTPKRLKPKFVDEIISVILEKAHGMFLLVKFQMDYIVGQPTQRKMQQALDTIPIDPNDIFSEAMKRIQRLQDGDRELALHALKWITKATRPLHINELLEALAVEEGDKLLHEDGIPTEDLVLEVCAGLVIIDEISGIVRLAHYTVQEYLASKQAELLYDSDLLIAKTCLVYLSFDTFANGYCCDGNTFELRLKKNHFFEYAARNWGYHVKLAGEEDSLLKMTYGILMGSCNTFESVKEVLFMRSDSPREHPRAKTFAERFGPLNIAAYLGLSRLTHLLLENSSNADLNRKDLDDMTPLSLAAMRGHEAVVKLLIGHDGVELNPKDNYGQTPLSFAAENGHDVVVKLLIGHDGVEVDSKDNYGRTPLSWAAKNGHEAVAKLLIDHTEVELNPKHNYGQTPLSFAAQNGHEAVVKLLIGHDRVELNSKDNYGRTPLSWAAMRGHDAVVKLLIGHDGVEVDSKHNYGQTPLSLAAVYGHEAVVKLLIGHDGVELDPKDKYGWTPLSLAAIYGHEAVVKLLVGHDGVELDSKDNYGQTPLSFAAENGHEAVVNLLIGHDGVEVNSKHNYGQTPLSFAAENGHEAVVKLLIGHDGVEVDSKDNYGRTPLSWAAKNGHEAVVKLLIDHDGVDLNSKHKYGRTPLSFAAEKGHETVVKLLIGHDGVELDPKYMGGQTPLSFAAKNGHEAVVRLLIGHDGVELNPKGIGDQTPLSLAAENGHEAVVRLLIGHDGVELNPKDNYGQTPLSFAAKNGHEAVVKLLISHDEVELNPKDIGGRTPLSWAAMNAHEVVVKILEDANQSML